MLQILNFFHPRLSPEPWRLLARGLLIAFFCIAACSKRDDGPPPPTVPPASESPEAAAEAAELIAEFAGDQDEARRIEIVFELAANGSPGAQTKLDEIYRNPPAARLKQEVVNAMTFMEPHNLDFALTLLSDAVGPQQPVELREAAMDALRDLEDARTINVWRSIANDPQAEIREAAAQAIEYLTARDGSK